MSTPANSINESSAAGLVTFDGVATFSTTPAPAVRYPITKYVVGPVGDAGYQTIQSALDAANSDATGGVVWIMPSPSGYTENLTFYDGSQIVGANASSLQTPDISSVVIIGIHTPPDSGNVTCSNINFTSTTDVFNSSDAGSTAILLLQCTFTITNGYVFNLLNWTGVFAFLECQESSSNNGIINNTSSAILFIENSSIGVGTSTTMITSGVCEISNSSIGCLWDANLTTTGILSSTVFSATITMNDDSVLEISFCNFQTSSGPSLYLATTQFAIISETIISSSNTPAIDGTSGSVALLSVVFWEDPTVSASVTIVPFGNYYPSTDVGPAGYVWTSNGTQAVPTFQALPVFPWTDVTSSTQQLATNNGYITDNAGGVTYTLPISANIGDTIYIVGRQGLATITPNATQQIVIGSVSGTVGPTGTCVSTNAGDCITLRCILPGTAAIFRASDFVGNWNQN